MAQAVDVSNPAVSEANEEVRLAARSIAHDFNNLLAAILGHAAYLRLISEPGSEIDETAATIEGAAERAKALSERLYQIGRRADLDAPAMAPVNVHSVAREVAATLSHSSTSAASPLVLELLAIEPEIVGDANQLNRLLMNLAVNAREAMGANGGQINIRTHDDARSLTLEVADHGPGIPPESRNRVFQPSYTTKNGGSGLGLSIVDRVARLHQASVEVDGNTPNGAVFRIQFPKP